MEYHITERYSKENSKKYKKFKDIPVCDKIACVFNENEQKYHIMVLIDAGGPPAWEFVSSAKNVDFAEDLIMTLLHFVEESQFDGSWTDPELEDWNRYAGQDEFGVQ